MAKSEFVYRSVPSKQCPYPLETTPKIHHVNACHKAIEIILINRFGKKNIPPCIWWRLKDTPKQVYGAQKYLWQIIRRLQKTYDNETILAMVRRKHLKFLSPKLIGRYQYWCKEEKDAIERIKEQKPRYNRVELEDKPVIDIEKKLNDDLLDWLDT